MDSVDSLGGRILTEDTLWVFLVLCRFAFMHQ